MPTVEGRDPLTGSRSLTHFDGKPSISCIATHAYWSRLSKQRELKYATSFQKSQEYLDGLRQQVSDVVFRDHIDNNTTPSYVFEEIKGIYHSPEHPLIHKGLLPAAKHEQCAGYTTPVEHLCQVSACRSIPKPQQANRSFYRPNSTHNYLTKTIALCGSHDGFNPKHGTPTRAQLLRNRVRFTSAPDLTYSYLAHRKVDGKQEAAHRKSKLAEEALKLKASRIEMDKTAGKYRKYMIGSVYNTATWLDSHMSIVNGMVGRSDRPASSLTPKSAPLSFSAKRRACSAAANNEHLRHRPPSTNPTAEHADAEHEVTTTKQTYHVCSYAERTRDGASKKLSSRSANLVPYSPSVNQNSAPGPLSSSIIIKSAVGADQCTHFQSPNKTCRSQKPVEPKVVDSIGYCEDNSKLSRRPDAPTPSLQLHFKKEVQEKVPYTSAEASQPVFMTNPVQNMAHESTAVSNHPRINTEIRFISPVDKPTLGEIVGDFAPPTEGMDAQITEADVLDTSSLVLHTNTRSVPVDLPIVDDKSDTISKSQEITSEELSGRESYIKSAQTGVHVNPPLNTANVKVTHTLGSEPRVEEAILADNKIAVADTQNEYDLVKSEMAG